MTEPHRNTSSGEPAARGSVPSAEAAAVLEERSRHADPAGRVAHDGSIAGYRANHTLPIRVELRRQLLRRRTQLTLGLLVALPVVLLLAFRIGQDDVSGGGLVELATRSGVNFALFSIFVSVSFLFVVVVALFFGDTVASEASWSSLKYLLAAPIPRHRLLRQKAIVSALLTVFALLLLPAVSLLVGVLAYGNGPLISPTGESVSMGRGVVVLLMIIAYLVLFYTWVAGLALLLTVATNTPLGAVGGALMASILSQILNQITALGDLRQFLPTYYSYDWFDLLSTDISWDEMARGVLTSFVYGTVFVLLAIQVFDRKDITS
ncbi:ABC transporter permease [Actinoalloteichus sp. AHMU CJ021]|uniref:ABC-2 type transport system permease protein n=1 Tax=Actinoalloteichus caeruleus DSM 43889 TaxID=1120930 RepID=A0ABT1JGA6_ACTCY|nr:ABC transporter permease subunit [Actinoalloteichus caeruleus]AUS77627.1 ABC transporter permease [Actinoalloteichus sp. AHMU CJ021]MCP2331523.1 ABC-2 type transport system permease protein [Actinoalloteichus caeruleus DSM 43889]